MQISHSSSPTHRIGNKAEVRACDYLQSQGLSLVVKNWHASGVGEIDLVMRLTDTELNASQTKLLVFVEVRLRKSQAYGGAAGSVTVSKRRKIMQTAACFLAEHPEYSDYDCRFDVVAIESQHIHWYPAAFILDA